MRLIEPRDFEVTARGQLVARAAVLDASHDTLESLAAHIRDRSAPRRYTSLSSTDLLLLRVNFLVIVLAAGALAAILRALGWG